MDSVKKLYRVKEGRVLAGVCTGIGEYFDIDPVIIRILWVVAAFLTAFVGALLAYFIVALIMPLRKDPAPQQQ